MLDESKLCIFKGKVTAKVGGRVCGGAKDVNFGFTFSSFYGGVGRYGINKKRF